MFRAARWLLIPCLAAVASAQDAKEAKPQDATGKKPLVQQLVDADDAGRPAALIAVIEDQIATRAVYTGQYGALAPLRDKVVPLLMEWVVESPDRVKNDADFRVACINALRDVVEKDAPEGLMKSLQQLAEDQFEDEAIRSRAMYALAQFGDRTLVNAQIQAALKQTSLPDLNQQYRGWATLCDTYYQLQDYESAVKAYRKTVQLLEGLPQKPRELPTTYYNFACSLALAGQTDEALSYIEKALEGAAANGEPLSRRMLDTDLDIASLRADARFAELLAQYYGGGEKKDGAGAKAKGKGKDEGAGK